MRRRLLLAAGLATGYVLGSRAGRQAYTRIQSGWREVRQSPQVRSTLDKARGIAEQRAPRLTGAVAGIASSAGSTAADVAVSVHQAGEQALVPLPEPATDAPAGTEVPDLTDPDVDVEVPTGTQMPVGVEATATDAAGGSELVEGSPGLGPVGAEATTKEDDDVER